MTGAFGGRYMPYSCADVDHSTTDAGWNAVPYSCYDICKGRDILDTLHGSYTRLLNDISEGVHISVCREDRVRLALSNESFDSSTCRAHSAFSARYRLMLLAFSIFSC